MCFERHFDGPGPVMGGNLIPSTGFGVSWLLDVVCVFLPSSAAPPTRLVDLSAMRLFAEALQIV